MADPITDLFATEAVRMMGDVKALGRLKARFSDFVRKGQQPKGAGFNWQSVVYQRTIPTGAVTFNAVQANQGGNTCVPTPVVINSALNLYNYAATQARVQSQQLCVNDIRAGYMSTQQVEQIRDNFGKNIADIWEDQDRQNYIAVGRYKYCATPLLPFTDTSLNFPLVVPTLPASQALLSYFYRRQNRDGANEYGGAYGYSDNKPIYMIFMESECQENIIKNDAGVRQDFRYAQMGDGNAATLLEPWGIDRPYGGFFHCCDDRMPHYDFVGGAWVERPFFDSENNATIGNDAEVSSLYNNAMYTDLIVWHPQVMERQMPIPMSTGGEDTMFKPVDYSGRIEWLNIPSLNLNPYQTIGQWDAWLNAAYRPELIQYGVTIRVSRCVGTFYSFPTCYV